MFADSLNLDRTLRRAVASATLYVFALGSLVVPLPAAETPPPLPSAQNAPEPAAPPPAPPANAVPATPAGAAPAAAIVAPAAPPSPASPAAAQADPPTVDATLDNIPEWRGDPAAYMTAIEILVVEVNEDKTRELGLKFGLSNLDSGSVVEGADVSLGPRFNSSPVPTFSGDELGLTDVGFEPRLPGLGLNLVGMDINGLVLSARLRALMRQGQARITTRPVVLALDGTEATIRVGSEIPYQDVSVSGAAESLAVAFEDVGVELRIVPRITDLNQQRVELDVRHVEVSSVSNFISIRGVDRPVFDSADTRTKVVLRSGDTLQMSSLKGRRRRVTREGIPLLMHIPFVGMLFSSRAEVIETTDIIFFITPHIIPPGKNAFVPYDFAHTEDLAREGVSLPAF